jgi:hypothetical protein
MTPPRERDLNEMIAEGRERLPPEVRDLPLILKDGYLELPKIPKPKNRRSAAAINQRWVCAQASHYRSLHLGWAKRTDRVFHCASAFALAHPKAALPLRRRP